MADDGATAQQLHGIELTMIDGRSVNFGEYKGKTVLVVNVASRCGLTPQYEDLEALQRKYQDQGFTVLGVPCNGFKGQEPGSSEQIQEFCTVSYGVTFPLTAKVKVNGARRHPLYAALTEFHTEELQEEITWNFEKFLVSGKGEVIARFSPKTSPIAPEVIAAIELALS
ncbi:MULTISPECIES: glutathione peroxidase [Micrococcaceae]|uniref:glutathione peroxidase n=1 Tax=Micrococcaceae TaxID=1268 RepID=UPI002AA7F296|nr:glutathione peroxidase [Pseudarthrobacter oxydans]WPU09800.1 glutathione peroxidase [Pseudarthrobacter oxydans]